MTSVIDFVVFAMNPASLILRKITTSHPIPEKLLHALPFPPNDTAFAIVTTTSSRVDCRNRSKHPCRHYEKLLSLSIVMMAPDVEMLKGSVAYVHDA